MKPKSTLLHFLVIAGSSVLATSAHAATRTWGGGDLNWTNTTASGWNAAAPGGADTANIGSGIVTVTTNITPGNTPNIINVNGGMLVISTGKLVSGGYSFAETFTIGSGATLRLNSWGYDVAGSLGGLDYGRDRLVVNGGIIEVVGNSSDSGRIFTVGTGGATLRSSVNSGQTWTLSRDVNSLYHDIRVNDGRTLTLDGTGNGVIGNYIVNTSGSGNITKAGTGTWTLTGANTYTGTTTVTAGTLAVNGSLANTSTTIGAGTPNTGKLQGSGTIAGSVTIQSGGTLAPGNSIESLGTGAVSFLSDSTYAYELQTNLYGTTPGLAGDLTDSNGTLNIQAGSILTLTDLAASTALAANSKLTLISYFGGWTGTELFTYNASTLNDGDTFTLGLNQWRFDYNDTTGGLNYTVDQSGATSFVTMTVVPEPGAALIGSLGLLALLRRRR